MNSVTQFTGHWVGWVRQSSDSQHSIESQTQAFHEFCDRHNIEDRTVISFVGSAMDNDPMTFFDRMRNEGVTAYDDYADLMRSGRVAGVWALDPTRYGRKKWLYSYMVEFAVDNGVVIYADGIGVINDSNFDAMVAISSMGSQADVKRLHGERAIKTRQNSCDAGIPPMGHVPAMYRLLRDDSGAVAGFEKKKSAIVPMDIATDLFLDGLSYTQIVKYLTGRGFDLFTHPQSISKAFNHPILYGHMGFPVLKKDDGLWRLEPGHIIPDGIYMAYNVNPAWWSDDIKQDMIAEIQNRLSEGGGAGSRRGVFKNPYSGIVKCGRCGGRMHYIALPNTSGGKYEYLYCYRRCGVKMPKLDEINAWFRERIEIALNHGILTLNHDEGQLIRWQGRLDKIDTSIDQHEAQLKKIAVEMLNASNRLRGIYEDEITRIDNILDGLTQEKHLLLVDKPMDPVRQTMAIEKLRRLTVDAFFNLPAAKMNQILRDLVGKARVYVDGDTYDIRF